jgi:Na+/H+ antiporter NhaD/arsenite permease-like protein
MVIRFILAGVAVAAVAGWPRSRLASIAALGVGALSGGILSATAAAAPMLFFLTAALGLAWLVGRTGVIGWAASLFAGWGRGSTRRLYALVCAASALLTAIVSLDGAVVLMVPFLLALARRCGLRLAPLLFGVVAVANAASVAVPEGNPTNLVVMSRLGLGPAAYLFHLFLPGACAAVLCALVPIRYLAPRRYEIDANDNRRPANPGFFVPWRIGAQIVGLLAALRDLVPSVALGGHALFALLGVAVGIAGLSAVANNLPVSAAVATVVTAGPGAYAALIGLTVGALATPHGSVATMISRDLAGADGDLPPKALAPAAALGVLCATFVLWTIVSSS